MHVIDRSVPLFFTRVRGTRILVTPQLVADVLRVSRVERQFTYCLAFAKVPWFLNMVMTFVLHPLSHYNSIKIGRAHV